MKKTIFAVAALIMAATLAFTGCSKKSGADNSVEDLKKRGVFILGLDDSFPPLGFRDENNKIVGYDIDLAKEVAARLGVEFKAQPINWDSKEQELATGQIDCIWNGFTMTAEREEALSFTKAYLDNAQVLIVRADGNIKSLSDMAGKTVGLQAGSSAAEAVEDNADFKKSLKEIIEFKDNIIALNDLEIGGVDGVVMDSVVGNYSIKTTGKPFAVVGEALASEKYGVAFRKQDVKLRDEVQKILEEMEADGTVEKICNNWFGANISVIGK